MKTFLVRIKEVIEAEFTEGEVPVKKEKPAVKPKIQPGQIIHLIA